MNRLPRHKCFLCGKPARRCVSVCDYLKTENCRFELRGIGVHICVRCNGNLGDMSYKKRIEAKLRQIFMTDVPEEVPVTPAEET